MIKNRKNLKYYLFYSLLFVLVCAIILNYFYLNDKTFISHGDGWKQHYKVLVYYSNYLRTIISNLFINHKLIIPNWDFSIGEGSDILGSLHYYAVGDPIAFLCVLFPEKYQYVFYDLMVLFKMYLSGVIFIKLCLYTKKDNLFGVLSGSLIYVFCTWVMLNATKHIFFLTPMICLPLIILGVEKIINGDKNYLFIFAVFYSAISHIYFFYMIVLLTVVYVALRLLTLYKLDIKKIINTIIKIFIPAVLGVMMAAIVLLPMINVLLHNNRIGVDYSLHPFYYIFYYERLFAVLLSYDYPEWLCMGFASPAILSFILSMKDIRKRPLLFLLNITVIIFGLFPIFGKIFNGMGYVVNRWCFAIALVWAYTFASEYEYFEENKKILAIFVPLFLLGGFVSAHSRQFRIIIPVIICLMYLGMLFIKSKYKQYILLGLIIINICFNGDVLYSDRYKEVRAKTAITSKEAVDVVKSNEAYELKQYLLENNLDSNVKFSGSNLSDNVGMLNGLSTTNYYFSMANPYIANFRSLIGLTEYSMYRFYSLDQRGTLLTLANVDYYLTPLDYDGLIPYGYEYVKDLNNYKLYRNNPDLLFGYTYDKAISYEDFSKMNCVEKEEALLNSVVVEKGNDKVSLSQVNIPYTFEDSNSVEVIDNGFNVLEDDGSIRLVFDGSDNSENYLLVQGLNYTDGLSYYFDSIHDVDIMVAVDRHLRDIEYHTNDYEFYNGRNNYVAYLGYYDNKLNSIELTFTRAGTYTYDDLLVVCKDVSNYQSQIEQLNKNVLKDVVYGTDELSGSINLDDDKYLLLSIPYSSGWKAYVDGKETEILRANECYMAIELAKGSHEIRLTYETEFLKIGAVVSCISIIGYGLYLVVKNKKYN